MNTQRVAASTVAQSDIALLVESAKRALPRMYLSGTAQFVQTTRLGSGGLRDEGTNLRYAAIVALGAARLDPAEQRALLAGSDAAQLAEAVTGQARTSADLGAAALAVWASAEVAGVADPTLVGRLVAAARSSRPAPTVDLAWTLTALLAVRAMSDVAADADQLAARLQTAQGAQGLFPHAVPRESLPRYRAHVGCFADQVYPIQALARHHAAIEDPNSLAAAQRCAQRIVRLQGGAGQWWWHYDVRTGEVVEGYPVYSVHQHAMAPMALLDLRAAGGIDYQLAVNRGLSWVFDPPETAAGLIHEETGAIWRKVGRRERRKAVRSIRSVTTAVSPRLRMRLLDRVCPPGVIDYECRPYELGWLLYAWVGARR
ncbi:MAG TPA: hypothetical protein VGJ59_06560 [Jatrophihabitantaceae bacterium]|jgi:hypothetical protein